MFTLTAICSVVSLYLIVTVSSFNDCLSIVIANGIPHISEL